MSLTVSPSALCASASDLDVAADALQAQPPTCGDAGAAHAVLATLTALITTAQHTLQEQTRACAGVLKANATSYLSTDDSVATDLAGVAP